MVFRILCTLLFFSSLAFTHTEIIAQAPAKNDSVSGTIERNNADGTSDPLPGVNVRWLGTNIGTVTNTQGRFSIPRTDSSATLYFSYAGYAGQIEVAPGQTEVSIAMDFVVSVPEVAVEEKRSGISIDNADVRTTEVISRGELLRCACCSLSESFQTSISVDVAPVDAVTGAQQIELLGLRGVYTQMITENFPGARGLAVPYALDYIPGSWLESISVSKGSASVLNGYESITGQINVELKKPWNSEPIYANIFANQTGRAEANFNAALDFGENWSSMLLAHGNFYDGSYDGNKDRFLDISRKAQANIFNRWSYIDSVKDMHLAGNVIYDRRRGGESDYRFGGQDSTRYGFQVQTRRYEAYGKFGHLIDKESTSSVALLLTATRHEQEAFFGRRNYEGIQNSLHARLIIKSDMISPLHHLAFGGSILLDDYDEQLDSQSFTRYERVPGLFGEYTFTAIKRLTAVFGLRADMHNIHGTFVTPRVHFRYQPEDLLTLRVSAGKGTRVANILAENYQVLSTSRQIIVEEQLRPERAWNYGISATHYVQLFGKTFALDAEYFRTDFENQLIVDADRDVRSVYFYNLKGESYSNSVQTQLGFSPVKNVDMRLAYRWYDVRSTYDGVLMVRPLQSAHKGLFTASWTAGRDKDWQLDGTLIYHGPGRVPSTAANPDEYRLAESFEGFFLVLAQVTKRFGPWEIYLGSENLTGFVQDTPVIAADKPFSEYFDGSLVWGPVVGRMVYCGMRLSVSAE